MREFVADEGVGGAVFADESVFAVVAVALGQFCADKEGEVLDVL